MARGKTLGIIAIKGGVGKTTLSFSLAASFAREFHKNVVVVDANFSTPHLGISLGLVNPKVSLHDVLLNRNSVFEALYQHESGFYILPGATGKNLKFSPLALKRKIDALKEYFDFVIIDSSPSLSDEMYATIAASDELLVVTSPDYPTLASTIHAVKIAKEKKTPILGMVINKSRNRHFEISPGEIEKSTGVSVLSVLPDDTKVMEALSYASPIPVYSPNRKISREYNKLAAFLLGEDYIEPSFFERFSGMLKGTFS